MSSLYFRAKLVTLPDGSMVDPATIEMVEPTKRITEVTSGTKQVKESTKIHFRSGRFRVLDDVTIDEVREALQGQALETEDEGG